MSEKEIKEQMEEWESNLEDKRDLKFPIELDPKKDISFEEGSIKIKDPIKKKKHDKKPKEVVIGKKRGNKKGIF